MLFFNLPVSTIGVALLWGVLSGLTGCNSPQSADAPSAEPTLPDQTIAARPPAASALQSGSSLWSGRFQPDWEQDWQVKAQGRWGEENIELIQQSQDKFSEFLRVHYPAGSASPSVSRKTGAPLGGGQFYAALGIAPQERLRLSYNLRFPTDFDFVKGGKLPGLYGGTGNSGGKIPNGRDGFSSRLMWRKQGLGEIYAYLPNSQDFGTSLGRGSWQFQPGQWHQIEQELWLNTPGQADGRARIWLDGNLVLDQRNLIFRTVPELKIEGIFFSTFFGGGDQSWASSTTTTVDFANFEIYRPSPKR